MAIANLMEKKWLWRKFHVVTADGVHEVVYNGKGAGYEEVKVDGETACRLKSLIWYEPHFDFTIGNANARVNVKVSPLMQIRQFDLIVNEMLVYSE